MTIDKLKSILSSQFGIDLDVIKESTDVVEDLGADSLDIAELLSTIEEEWHVPPIPDSALVDIHTVGELAGLVESRVAAL
ncbi:MAG: phosphopantetheine-binding protein [Oscillospiraceae bacterium]|jgi:acyl carrier protein|nr:phosphopantetheine-binding protein [Oscillospiraceae bacterium]